MREVLSRLDCDEGPSGGSYAKSQAYNCIFQSFVQSRIFTRLEMSEHERPGAAPRRAAGTSATGNRPADPSARAPRCTALQRHIAASAHRAEWNSGGR